MHEISIAKNIIDEAKKHGEVNSIEIDCGELAHLPAKDLEDAMKKLVKWDVKINETESIVECICGYKGRPKIIEKSHHLTLFECPKCGNLPKILKGGDIIIKKVGVK